LGPYLLWATDATIESDELEEADRTISPTLAMIAIWVSREKESGDVKKVSKFVFWARLTALGSCQGQQEKLNAPAKEIQTAGALSALKA
jgi:hypothetical protein